ncbi:MAG TPA: FliM/FliN family flagellar motor switch protein [Rhizomicrobium sp.]|jgi:flagellar motor switch protein FliN/FliY
MTVTTIRAAEAAKIDRPLERGEVAKPGVIGGELLRGVRVALNARLGEASMTVEELMALKTGSVVTLQAALADHVDLYLNDNLVARGEIVAVGDKYGVRIVEIVPLP